jgi:hypothetical protein
MLLHNFEHWQCLYFIMMTKVFRNILLILLATSIGFLACKKDVAIPDSSRVNDALDISFKVPQGWPSPYYSFVNNQLTNAGFKLGRKLFYDTRLSRDNTISCGSCHQSFAAFANADHDVSHGIDGLLGTRNAPGLFNLNWHTSFMWDGGINHIEVQPLAPLDNPVEMDEKMVNILEKLKADFGSEYNVKLAAAQRTLQKFGSPELVQYLDNTGLGNSPELIKLFSNIGLSISESTAVDGESRGYSQVSPQQASAEIDTLRQDSEFIKLISNKNGTGHREAVKRWQNLHALAYPDNV